MARSWWLCGPRLTTAIAVALMLFFGVNPIGVATRLAYAAYHVPGALFKLPAPAPHTLKAAILNVTTDFTELSSIVQDFLHSPGVDPSVERHFRDYLAIRSRSSNPRLESALNWTLFFYTVAAPFVALSLLSKLVGGSSASGREPLVQEPQAALPPVAPVRSSSSSKQERGSKREPGRQRVQGMSLLDPGTPHDQGEGRLDLLEEADRERVGIHVRAY